MLSLRELLKENHMVCRCCTVIDHFYGTYFWCGSGFWVTGTRGSAAETLELRIGSSGLSGYGYAGILRASLSSRFAFFAVVDQANELKWLTKPAEIGRHFTSQRAGAACVAVAVDRAALVAPRTIAGSDANCDCDVDRGGEYSICSLFVVASLRLQLLSTILPCLFVRTPLATPFVPPTLFVVLCCAHTFRKHYTNNSRFKVNAAALRLDHFSGKTVGCRRTGSTLLGIFMGWPTLSRSKHPSCWW